MLRRSVTWPIASGVMLRLANTSLCLPVIPLTSSLVRVHDLYEFCPSNRVCIPALAIAPHLFLSRFAGSQNASLGEADYIIAVPFSLLQCRFHCFAMNACRIAIVVITNMFICIYKDQSWHCASIRRTICMRLCLHVIQINRVPKCNPYALIK